MQYVGVIMNEVINHNGEKDTGPALWLADNHWLYLLLRSIYLQWVIQTIIFALSAGDDLSTGCNRYAESGETFN